MSRFTLACVAGLLTAATACNTFLVGGECKPGWTAEAGRCVIEDGEGGGDADDDASGGAGGGTPDGGAGGADVGTGSSGDGGGSTGTSTGCDPLTMCGDTCVDTQNDPHHCGSCGWLCPTGICEDGACVGGPAGHLVALGLDPTGTAPPSAQVSRLAGNAVFLHPREPLRVLAIDAPQPGSVQGADIIDVLEAEAEARGRTMVVEHAAPSGWATAMADGDLDVVVFTSHALARPSALATALDELPPVLGPFFDGGGVMVAVAGTSARAQLATFLDGASLLAGATIESSAGGPYDVADWTDAIAIGLAAPFAAPDTVPSAAFFWNEPADANVVVVDADGNPVAIHRAFAPSFDFGSPGN